MQKKWIVVFCCWFALASVCQAGLFKNSVDLADLSEVPEESLEGLQDSEFAVFLAQIRLNTAKAAERRASGGVKTANRTIEAEELDMKAAKAELKAAKANLDEERSIAASARITGADEDLKTAKALLKWKTLDRDAREHEVALAKSALDLAEARRDLARVRLLLEQGATAVDKYDMGDFESNVSKRQKEFEAAGRKAGGSAAKAEKAKEEWDRMAKSIEFVEVS